MCALVDILQDKIDNILSDTKGVKKNIDDILVFKKESLHKNMDKLQAIFSRMWTAGITNKATNYSLGINEITHLDYVISREDIKIDMKKVTRIMDLFQHTFITEVQSLIGMANYYSYMWPRSYQVLNLMNEADSVPKDRKILRIDNIEFEFKETKSMVSTETLTNYPYWKIPFTVHKDDYENIWVLLLVRIKNLLHYSAEYQARWNITTLR